MKHGKTMLLTVLALTILFAFPAPVMAATYRDVPSSHYAYTAVDWVSNPVNGNFMVGDANNNFNPTKTMDKFETAKIFAVAAGYKYTSPTPSEQELFDRAYETYKTTLDSMAKQYAKWSKTADREIAYLLYQSILTTTDVGKFITKSNGTETVNNVTKQEAIAFMIRLDKKQANADAITLPYHSPYKDDAQINADYKKYLYYAKEAGIAAGSDGYINPARNITRAEIAQMFYNMLANRSTTAVVNGENQQTINGVFDSLYQSTHIYITVDNVPKIYKLASNVVVVIDNAQKAATNLVKGMTVTALVNASGDIISIVARTPSTTDTTTTTPSNTSLSENEGYVTAVSTVSGNVITVKTQRVKLTGEIVTDEKTYTTATNCTIKRGDSTVAFSDIKVNDIITFQYNGMVMYSIVLQEKDRKVYGKLLEKKYVTATATPVLVVEDAKGVKYELRVTSTTEITRNSSRGQSWSNLRVGDEIEAQCEYDKIVAVYAKGNRSTVNGVLEELHITKDTQQLLLRKSDNTTVTYTVTTGTYDAHNLRVGMELRLYLDSLEVYDVNIVSGGNTANTGVVAVYGYVKEIVNNTTFVVEDYDNYRVTYTIRIDTATTDTRYNRVFNINDLRKGLEVYVVFTAVNSNQAKAITIF